MTPLRALAAFCTAFLTLPLLSAAPARAEAPVTVFAAASLRGALEAAAADYSAAVTVSYGGSGSMARQIAQGAPADAVLLASPEWMDWLDARDLLLPQSRRDLLRNRLVLIGPAGSAPLADPDTAGLLAALDGGRLAMGQRDAVPAGSYARAWLTRIGAWEALAPHLAETDDVRGALTFVALGEAPLGIVYATDAVADPRVSVRWQIPQDQHPPILYPAAALTEAGRSFLASLETEAASAIFADFGFLPVGASN